MTTNISFLSVKSFHAVESQVGEWQTWSQGRSLQGQGKGQGHSGRSWGRDQGLHPMP